MKIALCGSTDFYPKMDEIKEYLQKKGATVLHPRDTSVAFSAQLKGFDDGKVKKDQSTEGRTIKHKLITSHMIAIKDCDAVLVVNMNKLGMTNYIGGNTFLEMGFAMAYGKPIYIYGGLPEYSPYFDEISGMKPIVLHEKLNLIM